MGQKNERQYAVDREGGASPFVTPNSLKDCDRMES